MAGVYTDQRLNLSKLGKVFDRKPRLQTGSVRINSGKEEEDVELGNLSSELSPIFGDGLIGQAAAVAS